MVGETPRGSFSQAELQGQRQEARRCGRHSPQEGDAAVTRCTPGLSGALAPDPEKRRGPSNVKVLDLKVWKRDSDHPPTSNSIGKGKGGDI